jgi:hypothetical protein
MLLSHRFEQGGLGLWGGPIYLISEYDIREDGPRLPLKERLLLIVDGQTDHIRWQQVGGELNSLKRTIERQGQGMSQRGLPDSGDVFD